MGMLLETTGSCKCLTALRTGMATGTYVLSTNVALQVAGIREGLVTVLTGEQMVAVMLILMP